MSEALEDYREGLEIAARRDDLRVQKYAKILLERLEAEADDE